MRGGGMEGWRDIQGRVRGEGWKDGGMEGYSREG
jgi:hypothetical protein